tara:strand:- start:46 stop:729 length:684 start_codon:yes stop_codon:yes gene_type:complete
MSHGMEDWHPNPEFFFKPGAGPVFDLGVYYLTQLINLNGPIKNVIASSSTVQKKRIISSKPRFGDKIIVETPTTLMGILEFHNQSKIQFNCSWDIWKHSHTNMEIYGIDGSMVIPDPNFFSGNILISNKDNEWKIVNNDQMLLGIPNTTDNSGKKIANYRGIGLSDMINSILKNKKSRCSLDLSLHVLEIMESIISSSENENKIELKTKPQKPEILTESEISLLKKF